MAANNRETVLKETKTHLKHVMFVTAAYAVATTCRQNVFVLYANEQLSNWKNPSITETELATILSIGFLCQNFVHGLIFIFYGTMANVYGYDKWITIQFTIQTIGVFLETYTKNIYVFIFGATIGETAIWYVGMAYIAWMVPHSIAATYIIYFLVSYVIGNLSGPILAGIVAFLFDYKTVFWVSVGISALSWIYSVFFILAKQKKLEKKQLTCLVVNNNNNTNSNNDSNVKFKPIPKDDEFPVILNSKLHKKMKSIELGIQNGDKNHKDVDNIDSDPKSRSQVDMHEQDKDKDNEKNVVDAHVIQLEQPHMTVPGLGNISYPSIEIIEALGHDYEHDPPVYGNYNDIDNYNDANPGQDNYNHNYNYNTQIVNGIPMQPVKAVSEPTSAGGTTVNASLDSIQLNDAINGIDINNNDNNDNNINGAMSNNEKFKNDDDMMYTEKKMKNIKWYHCPQLTCYQWFVLLCVIYFAAVGATTTVNFMIYYPAFIIEQLNENPVIASMHLVTLCFMYIVGQIIIQIKWDNVETRKGKVFVVLCTSTVLSVTSGIFYPFFYNPTWLFWFYDVAFGSAGGALAMASDLLILELQPTVMAGKVSGIKALVGNYLIGIDLFVITFLWPKQREWFFWIECCLCVSMMILSTVLCLIIKERK